MKAESRKKWRSRWVLVAVAATTFLTWCAFYIYGSGQYALIRDLAASVEAYIEFTGTAPKDWQELVAAGYLPATSRRYNHRGFLGPASNTVADLPYDFSVEPHPEADGYFLITITGPSVADFRRTYVAHANTPHELNIKNLRKIWDLPEPEREEE